MNTIKKLIAAGLLGSIAFSLSAQTTPPDATVNAQGQLVIGDTVIDPPSGTVDANGDLNIDGTVIAAPDATVNADGSITLADSTVLQVPDLPEGGDFIVSWFGSDFYDFKPAEPPTVNQWYFSYTFKNMFHFAANNWFYSLEMDATIYVRPDSGNRSLEEGIWVYTRNLFNGQVDGTWVWVSGANGFTRLEDSDSDGDYGDEPVSGFLYVKNPSGYPSSGEGFFFFGEFEDGNYIWRVGDLPNAQKIQDPT